MIQLSGLVVERPEEWSDYKTCFQIPNREESLLDFNQLKTLHEFITDIIEEHNSKNPLL